LIVQYVEPDFLDSLEGFPKNEVKKIKIYLRALVAHIEKSETVEDLKAINLSEFSLYLLSKRAHDDLTLKLLKSPEIEPSRIPSLYYLSGRSTEKQFPNRDLYLYKFDAYKLFFCLRGQVCTLLRVERNALS